MATDFSNAETETIVRAPSEPSASPRKGTADLSLVDLLIILAERKRTLLSFTASSALLAICISLLLPVRYTATVTLLPPQQSSSLSSMLASQLGSLGGIASLTGGGLNLKNQNDMYVAMFRSRVVEDAMVQKCDLMREYHSRFLSAARKSFENVSTVDGNTKDGLIHIAVEDGNPTRAAALANAYVDQFRHLSQNLAITEAGQRRLFFEQQLDQAKSNLADAEEALERSEQKSGMLAPEGQARALIESAASLRAQIGAKEVQIRSLQTFATPENGQLIQAQQELAGLQAQLAKLGGTESGHAADLILPRGRVTEASLEYVRRMRDVKYDETIFEILARQFEMAKLDEAKEGALIQVVDPAIPPDRRSFPNRTLIVLLGTFCGFGVGVITVLFKTGWKSIQIDPVEGVKFRRLHRALSRGA